MPQNRNASVALTTKPCPRWSFEKPDQRTSEVKADGCKSDRSTGVVSYLAIDSMLAETVIRSAGPRSARTCQLTCGGCECIE